MSDAGTEPLAAGFSFLEVPRWHHGRLWAADMFAERVVAVAPNGAVATIDVPGVPAGIAWTPDERLLILTRDGRLWRDHNGGIVEVAAAVHPGPAPCNELTVDAHGTRFVGIFGLASGALVAVAPDGSSRVAADGLLLPNGQALTADGGTLLVAESAGQRITAFTVGAGGTLGSRRVWATFGEPASARTLPEVLRQVTVWADGIALDAAGGVWMADPFGKHALRVEAGGEVTETVSTGELACYACALGGEDGRTLFLCAAPAGVDEATRDAQRAGVLLTCRVQVSGAAGP